MSQEPKPLELFEVPNPLLPVYFQIKKLLDSLTNKKIFKNVKTDLLQLVSQLGIEGEKFMFKCLLSQIDLKENTNKKEFSSIKTQFLSQQIIETINQAHCSPFIDYFSQIAIESKNKDENDITFMNNLFQVLKLNKYQEIALTLSMCINSENKVKKQGIDMMKEKLDDFKNNQQDKAQWNQEILHMLLGFLKSNQEFENFKAEINHIQEHNSQYNINPVFQPFMKCSKIIQNDYKLDLDNIIKPHLLLKDIGPRMSQKANQLDLLLKQYINQIDEKEILMILVMMANKMTIIEDTVQKSLQNLFFIQNSNPYEGWNKVINPNNLEDQNIQWNYQVFIKWIHDSKKINWKVVMLNLDSNDVIINDEECYANLFKMFQFCQQQFEFNYPLSLIIEKWKNKQRQVEFLQYIAPNINNSMNYTNYENKINPGEVKKAQMNLDAVSMLTNKTQPGIKFWKLQNIYDILFSLSESDYYDNIRKLFDYPLSLFQDLILYGIFFNNLQAGEALLEEVIGIAITQYLIQIQSSFLEQLWHLNQSLFISCVCALYRREAVKSTENCQFNLSKVLDLSQAIKESLLKFVNWTDYEFTVPLAILGGKREFLHFEQWFVERISIVGEDFIYAVLVYVKKFVINPLQEAKNQNITNQNQNNSQIQQQMYDQIIDKAQLSAIQVSKMFETFNNYQYKNNRIHSSVRENFYSLTNLFPNFIMKQSTGQEIEEQSSSYFVKIFKEDISIENAIQLLKTFKSSSSNQEKEIYSCMLTSMLDEYRFHDNYPPKELGIMGALFGALLAVDIIGKEIETLFLNLITDSLKQDGNQNRVDFGLRAIEYMKDTVANHQQFCEGLFEIRIMKEKYFVLLKEVHQLFQNKSMNLKINKITLTDIQSKYKKFQQEKKKPPTQNEKIQFGVKQSTQQVQDQEDTLDKTQLKSVIEMFTEEQKVLNNIQIQLDLKDKITSTFNQFTESKITQTVTFIKSIIDQTNVNQWMSKYLVVKRIPYDTALHKSYACCIIKVGNPLHKTILQETFNITKIMIDPKYNLPNQEKQQIKNFASWVGLITIGSNRPLLKKELHLQQILLNNFPENTQVIIPLICKILEQSKDSIFKKNPWILNLLSILNEIKSYDQAESKSKIEISILFKELKVNESLNLLKTHHLELIKMSQVCTTENNGPAQILITELPEFINLDPNLLQYQSEELDLKYIIAQALDGAIQDIIPPVISRSVIIALITTKELIFKDFAFEQNISIIFKATQQMIQNLSGSLAIVTCRDPLKMSFGNKMKKILEGSNLSEEDKEKIITVSVIDNIDLGCKLIQRTVMNKAVMDIQKDERILEQMRKRIAVQEKNIDFVDEKTYSQFAFLPDCLKPKSQTSQEDIDVYKEFTMNMKAIDLSSYNNMQNVNQNKEIKFNENFTVFFNDVKKSTKEILILTYEQSNYYNEVFNILQNQVYTLKLSNEQVINSIDQIIKTVFEQKYDIYTHILIDCIKFLHQQLIKTNKISLCEIIQKFFATRINQKASSRFPIFIKYLIQNETLSGKSFAKSNYYISSIHPYSYLYETIQSIILNMKQNVLPIEIITQAFSIYKSQYESKLSSMSNLQELKKYNIIVENQLNSTNFLFHDIVELNKERIMSYNLSDQYFFNIDQQVEKNILNLFNEYLNTNAIDGYVTKLESKIWNTNQNIQKFVVVSLDFVIKTVMNIQNQYQGNKLCDFENVDHQLMDQFTFLMMYMYKRTDKSKQHCLLEKILDSILLVISKYHQKTNFNQKLFFKCILNIIIDIYRQEDNKDSKDLEISFKNIVNLLHKIQPLIFPGFTVAWIELISSKIFMPIVIEKQQKLFSDLICNLMKFFSEMNLQDQTFFQCSFFKGLYMSTLKMMLEILIDWRDFFTEEGCQICIYIPEKFVQIRNIVLAAFPKKMAQLQDPVFVTQNDKLELAEFYQQPTFNFHFFQDQVFTLELKQNLTNYLQNPTDEEFQQILSNIFNYNNKSQNFVLDTKMMTILTLLLPLISHSLMQSKDVNNEQMNQVIEESYNFLFKLISLAPIQLKDQILNIIINSIRYPNQITQFYIKFIQIVFTKDTQFKELTVKIILDRIYMQRPHPWGIMYTIIELFRNPIYNMRAQDFIREMERIEDVFVFIRNMNAGVSQNSATDNQQRVDQLDFGPIHNSNN